MKKHQYFLQLEHFTKSVFETDIMDSNVKVIIPSGIPEKFMVLNTEKTKFEKTSPEKDIKKLEKTYKDFDFFYLCISEEIKSYTEFVLYSSDDTYVDDIIAFVGIPKNDDGYIKSKQDYLDGIQVALENYYNQINEWDILVMDKQCDGHPEKYYSYVVDDFLLSYNDGKFDPKPEEWFKMCKTKYGITQQEIDEAKNIIKFYKWYDKSVYKIQSKII